MNLIKSISSSVLSTLLLAFGLERLAARLDPLASHPTANLRGNLRSSTYCCVACALLRS
jgi:hypothetical protein